MLTKVFQGKGGEGKGKGAFAHKEVAFVSHKSRFIEMTKITNKWTFYEDTEVHILAITST